MNSVGRRCFPRRVLLGSLGSAALALAGAGLARAPRRAAAQDTPGLGPCEIGPRGSDRRARDAMKLRLEAAQFEEKYPRPALVCNGDDALYPNRIASFSKGLPHNARGEVDLAAYQRLLTALQTGDPADFERIPLGGSQRLVNPQAGLAFELLGPDSHALSLPPPPAFSSAEEAAEMAEMYWMALMRDIPFADYPSHPLAQRAAADLGRLPGYRGPRVNGQVTPDLLYRLDLPGALVGPYISQFFWLNVPYGPQQLDQRIVSAIPGVDYLTAYPEWLASQNGAAPSNPTLETVPRYMRNGRDLAQWVRVDVLFQASFNALLVLFALGVPPNPGNPYRDSRTQIGFGTLGDPYAASQIGAVATRALKSVWYQKWNVHRRLRPEEFGGRVHNQLTRTASYPIHPDLLASGALEATFTRFGSYLLPQAYPGGSPLHPSYGAGHATVAGACVTVLKALFDETFVIPRPVVATPDGLALQPYVGPPLTVGGELNKLAANIGVARSHAGIHWRSDTTESLRLGEELAIRFLREEKLTFNEQVYGFSITRFDGSTVTI